jgi:nicotinate-nucleotide adenylyltransferase
MFNQKIWLHLFGNLSKKTINSGYLHQQFSMKKIKRTALFFGSFNPIHIGHLAIANYITEFAEVDELWFVVSPHNPLKEKETLLDDYQRLEMVNIAIREFDKFRASAIEFSLSKPSYTIHTLEHLAEKYPDRKFVLIMGADSLQSIAKWKNYETILANYEILVYPRKNSTSDSEVFGHNVRIVNAPEIEISSSFIRQSIKQKKNMRFFLTESVYNYLTEMHFYEK